MKAKSKQPSAKYELPSIPDDPNSPLPGWKHYGVMKLAEQKLHDDLAQIEYNGRLIGLEVNYTTGKDNFYTMSYGYDVEAESPNSEVTPLDDKVILGLYQLVKNLIVENTGLSTDSFRTGIEISLNRKPKKVRIVTRICEEGECENNPSTCVGNIRVLTKKNKKPWRCTHVDPNDNST